MGSLLLFLQTKFVIYGENRKQEQSCVWQVQWESPRLPLPGPPPSPDPSGTSHPSSACVSGTHPPLDRKLLEGRASAILLTCFPFPGTACHSGVGTLCLLSEWVNTAEPLVSNWTWCKFKYSVVFCRLHVVEIHRPLGGLWRFGGRGPLHCLRVWWSESVGGGG